MYSLLLTFVSLEGGHGGESHEQGPRRPQSPVLRLGDYMQLRQSLAGSVGLRCPGWASATTWEWPGRGEPTACPRVPLD